MMIISVEGLKEYERELVVPFIGHIDLLAIKG